VSIRLLCGERDSILYLQVAARQRHIAESGKTFHGHVYYEKGRPFTISYSRQQNARINHELSVVSSRNAFAVTLNFDHRPPADLVPSCEKLKAFISSYTVPQLVY